MSIKEHVKSMVKSVILLDKRRNRINMCNRAKLRNMEMSILSSNCAGGVMSHDLGLPFRSQFVNLALRPKDFVKYLRDLDYYNSLDVIFPEDVEPCWAVANIQLAGLAMLPFTLSITRRRKKLVRNGMSESNG